VERLRLPGQPGRERRDPPRPLRRGQRDESGIERTFNVNVVVRSTRAEAERVWAPYAAAHRPREGEGRLVVGGPVEEVAATLTEYAGVGFRHPILIFRSPWDLETIAALGAIREAIAALA